MPNPLEEALKLTTGTRREAYGHPKVNFTNIAAGWSVIFGVELTPEQVALANIWTKICRETNKPDPDNIVDIAGYANTYWMCSEEGGAPVVVKLTTKAMKELSEIAAAAPPGEIVRLTSKEVDQAVGGTPVQQILNERDRLPPGGTGAWLACNPSFMASQHTFRDQEIRFQVYDPANDCVREVPLKCVFNHPGAFTYYRHLE